MALAAILSLLVNPGLVAVLGIYVVLNVMYSFYLKQLALVDIMGISGGFVLRTIAGALAISATISVWLLVCTFFVALLMAAGKRRIEIATLSNHKAETRPSLDRTSIAFSTRLCLELLVQQWSFTLFTQLLLKPLISSEVGV